MSDVDDNIDSDNKAPDPKSRGLGRGLNALFEDEEGDYLQSGEDSSSGDITDKNKSGGYVAPAPQKFMVGVDMLTPGSWQPRHNFDEKALDQLAESIKTHGLLQPIVVRPKGTINTGKYEIIAGERRWRAAQKAQIYDVPVIVMNISDEEALEIALIENLQREDLNPVEEAAGYRRLMDEYNHTQEALAESLNKSRSHIANMVRLLNLPDKVLEYLEKGEISTGHARALVTSDEPEKLVKLVVSEGLNVRQTEKLVTGAENDAPSDTGSAPEKPAPSTKKPAKDADTLALESDISNALGMRVSIDNRGANGGNLRIEYKSLDQLDELIKRLSNSGYTDSRLSG